MSLPNVLVNMFKKQTYINLYDQFKIYMSEPSNWSEHRESLQKLENILKNAVDFSKYLMPSDNILLYMLPIVSVPTFFILLITQESLFFWLALYEVAKLIYYLNNGISIQKIVFGIAFIQTIQNINTGLDLGINAVKITQQSLDTYLVSIEYVSGIITNITTNAAYIGEKITKGVNYAKDISSAGINDAKNIASSAVEYSKAHPYLTTTILGCGIIAGIALARLIINLSIHDSYS